MSYHLIEKQVIYSGQKIRLELHHLVNDQDHRITKEVVVHPGAVVILPFLDPQTILLIRNRRYAISQLLTELPAGTLDIGEAPMNCAGRELLEETGYLATRLKPIANFFPSPGILSEKMYTFAAYDLQKATPALEEGEEIEVMPTPFTAAIDMIRTGEIQDGKTIATLLMYERFFAKT
ncbi:MAG TPA: NUDIX hydrolase [Tepidisphaeraceae bacterium]|nr:NUDIX hydrolase [Tepidisphaeraceae bacterium]